MDPIKTKILVALRDEVGGNPRMSDSLAGLGIDSLRMAELATELETSFGVPMDMELLDVETVGELVDYIRSRSSTGTRKC